MGWRVTEGMGRVDPSECPLILGGVDVPEFWVFKEGGRPGVLLWFAKHGEPAPGNGQQAGHG